MSSDFATHARFPVTRRSAVAGAGSDDPEDRARAFDVLVRAYWRPVYAHVRLRWRRAPEDARDLTQGFFARAFEKRWLGGYEPGKALFRTYLKTCLDRFVMEAARDEGRHKRGGGTLAVSLDFDVAEQELASSDARTPETCFDAEWTRNVLAASVAALEGSCRAQGKDVYFTVFRRYALEGDDGLTYAAVASELGLSASDVTNYLSWTRRELRRLVLEQLRDITTTDEELESEARTLLGVGAR